MRLEAIVGIIGVLVSIAGIYFGTRATRVVVVHEKANDTAKRAERPRPHGIARVMIGVGMLLSVNGMGVFALVVVTGMTQTASQFGRPGSFQPPSLELIGPAVALVFAGIAITAAVRFLSGDS